MTLKMNKVQGIAIFYHCWPRLVKDRSRNDHCISIHKVVLQYAKSEKGHNSFNIWPMTLKMNKVQGIAIFLLLTKIG